MAKDIVHQVPDTIKENALISENEYEKLYKESLSNSEEFWSKQAKEYLEWVSPWQQTYESDLSKGEVSWFIDGKINASQNCIDSHLDKRANQVAIIWEGDDPSISKSITYQELHESVCQFANALKERGVKKGDRVCIYMPMIPEAAYAMLLVQE